MRLHASLEMARARAAALKQALAVARAETEEARRRADEARVVVAPPGQAPEAAPQEPAPATPASAGALPTPESAPASTSPSPNEAPSSPTAAGASARWLEALATLGTDASTRAMRTLFEATLAGGAEGLAEAAATRQEVVPVWLSALLRSEANAERAREVAALLRQIAPSELPATVPAPSWTLRPFADAGVLQAVLRSDGDASRRVLARVAARPLTEGDDTRLRAVLTKVLTSSEPAGVTLAARIVGQHAATLGGGLEAALHTAWVRLQDETPERRARAAARVLHAAARLASKSDETARSRWRDAALQGLAADDARQRVAATLLAESLLDRPVAFDPHAPASSRAEALAALRASWPAK